MKKTKVIKLKNGVLLCGDAAKVMPKNIPDESVDLVLTSPPYDNLRTYQGFTFDFQAIAKECSRVLKPGGVIVWNTADATINGTETCSSFKQAIYFKEVCGLRLHDTMLFIKNNPAPGDHGPRYRGCFEYLFCFSKGKPKTFNPIQLKGKEVKKILSNFRLEKTGRKDLVDRIHRKSTITDFVHRNHPNIFYYTLGGKPKEGNHPAVFPEQLAEDMVRTWTNPGDLVLDPMVGSGTTCSEASRLDRAFVGIDISFEYLKMAKANIERADNTYYNYQIEEEARLSEIPIDFK